MPRQFPPFLIAPHQAYFHMAMAMQPPPPVQFRPPVPNPILLVGVSTDVLKELRECPRAPWQPPLNLEYVDPADPRRALQEIRSGRYRTMVVDDAALETSQLYRGMGPDLKRHFDGGGAVVIIGSTNDFEEVMSFIHRTFGIAWTPPLAPAAPTTSTLNASDEEVVEQREEVQPPKAAVVEEPVLDSKEVDAGECASEGTTVSESPATSSTGDSSTGAPQSDRRSDRPDAPAAAGVGCHLGPNGGRLVLIYLKDSYIDNNSGASPDEGERVGRRGHVAKDLANRALMTNVARVIQFTAMVADTGADASRVFPPVAHPQLALPTPCWPRPFPELEHQYREPAHPQKRKGSKSEPRLSDEALEALAQQLQAEPPETRAETVSLLVNFLLDALAKQDVKVQKVIYGGSFYKGTALRSNFDVDLVFLVSSECHTGEEFLKDECQHRLKQILDDCLKAHPEVQVDERRRVNGFPSARAKLHNLGFDILVGREFVSKDQHAQGIDGTWAEMQLAAVQDLVLSSGSYWDALRAASRFSSSLGETCVRLMADEIDSVRYAAILLKHWRDVRKLRDFKSFFAEMIALAAIEDIRRSKDSVSTTLEIFKRCLMLLDLSEVKAKYPRIISLEHLNLYDAVKWKHWVPDINEGSHGARRLIIVNCMTPILDALHNVHPDNLRQWSDQARRSLDRMQRNRHCTVADIFGEGCAPPAFQ